MCVHLRPYVRDSGHSAQKQAVAEGTDNDSKWCSEQRPLKHSYKPDIVWSACCVLTPSSQEPSEMGAMYCSHSWDEKPKQRAGKVAPPGSHLGWTPCSRLLNHAPGDPYLCRCEYCMRMHVYECVHEYAYILYAYVCVRFVGKSNTSAWLIYQTVQRLCK